MSGRFGKFFGLFALIGLLALAGCNTMEGIGKDTRALGDALTGSARDNKAY